MGHMLWKLQSISLSCSCLWHLLIDLTSFSTSFCRILAGMESEQSSITSLSIRPMLPSQNIKDTPLKWPCPSQNFLSVFFSTGNWKLLSLQQCGYWFGVIKYSSVWIQSFSDKERYFYGLCFLWKLMVFRVCLLAIGLGKGRRILLWVSVNDVTN